MKKLLLATLVVAGAVIPASAQGLYMTSYGKEIPNGSTITYKDYQWEQYEEDYAVVTINPGMFLVGDRTSTATVSTKSNVTIGLCAGGTCVRLKEITKKDVPVDANAPLDLILDWEEEIYGTEQELTIPEITVEIEAWYNDDPTSVYKITLVMGGFEATAGIEGVEASQDNILFNNNVIKYDLNQISNLSVYSLSGKTIMNQTISGNGSVSLDGLSKGIYLYRVAGKNGKVVKTAKVIVK